MTSVIRPSTFRGRLGEEKDLVVSVNGCEQRLWIRGIACGQWRERGQAGESLIVDHEMTMQISVIAGWRSHPINGRHKPGVDGASDFQLQTPCSLACVCSPLHTDPVH